MSNVNPNVKDISEFTQEEKEESTARILNYLIVTFGDDIDFEDTQIVRRIAAKYGGESRH